MVVLRFSWLYLFVSLILCENAVAFLPPTLKRVSSSASSCTSKKRSSSVLSAYYFGMENNEEEDGYGNNNSNNNKPDAAAAIITTTMSSTTATSGVGRLLNHQRASLARVVAAFPPTGHALDLNHIEDVMVIDVDDQHMDIQATICEEESCSAVSVPVLFPNPCQQHVGITNNSNNNAALEECVLENLEFLDHQAELLLQYNEWEATNQQYQDEINQERNQLLLDSIKTYPTWWMVPPPEMAEERETLQNLLNEAEFVPEVHAMAIQSLQGQAVDHAAVIAIGPAGIILRARLATTGELVEVPICFPTPAESSEQLRNKVLDAVDSAAT